MTWKYITTHVPKLSTCIYIHMYVYINIYVYIYFKGWKHLETGDSFNTRFDPFLIPEGGLAQRKRWALRHRNSTAVSGVEYVRELHAVARREFPLKKWS